MATTIAKLEAVLAADTRQFDRAMDRCESRMGSVAKTMGKAGLAGAALGLGAAAKAEAARRSGAATAVRRSCGPSRACG